MGRCEDEGEINTSGTEDLNDLFGAEAEVTRPAEKLVEYRLPSSGDALSVHVVGHHVLWGNHLWNGAQWMSDYIDLHPGEFKGKRILELGAGAGLPSILATKAGARMAVCTDYPDEELIDNINKNITTLLTVEEQARCLATGYLWGAEPTNIFSLNGGQPFDIVIMCDVIFNHSEHRRLLKSTVDCLTAEGVAWCVFSHYRPWYMDRDLALFALAEEEFPLKSEFVGKHQYDTVDSAFKDERADSDIVRTVFAHRLFRAQLP